MDAVRSFYGPATVARRSGEAPSNLEDVSSVAVTVLWGEDILRVDHLSPPRAYRIGGRASCDCIVPCDALGQEIVPIVAGKGMPTLVVVPGVTGIVESPMRGARTLAEFVRDGHAHPSETFPGAFEVELPRGTRARIEVPNTSIAIEVSASAATASVGRGLLRGLDAGTLIAFGGAFLLNVGVVAMLALFVPTPMDGDDEETPADLALIQHLLGASSSGNGDGDGDGEAGRGDGADALGARDGEDTEAKSGDRARGKGRALHATQPLELEGPSDNARPNLAREAALQQAAEFGMIGLLTGAPGGAPSAPTSPWGRADSRGVESTNSLGSVWGDGTGDSFGAGGLGLSGVGEGGGGEGINIGAVGTVGRGSGVSVGEGFGCACGYGTAYGFHQVRVPTVIGDGGSFVSGRVPAEVIQRIVRQNFGRFRLCYEDGLRTNPKLEGRVTVKFVIDRRGSVALAADGGSELADPSVVSCVVRSFNDLSFPEPAGGVVSVVYPIVLSPAP